MAAYTPKKLRIPTNITASYVTIYTAPAATTGIIRTISVSTLTTHSVQITHGTGADTNHLLPLTQHLANIPYFYNGMWVIEATEIVQAKADAITSNAPVVGLYGYEYA